MSGDGLIFLYGPPGSGKSAVGAQLARDLSLPFIDLDEMIVQAAGRPVADIFAAEGEAGFRQRERAVLDEAIARGPAVIALGGGALLDAHSRQRAAAAGQVICLNAPLDVLAARLATQAGLRPLLSGEARPQLQALLARRADHYASFDRQLDASAGSVEQIAWDAQVLLGRYHVSGMGAGYDVLIRSGSLDDLGQAMLRRGLLGPVALVSDENVARLYADRVSQGLRAAGYTVHLVLLPPGEQFKTLESVSALWQAFLAAGLERSSTVVALGGGVVGDLAGFAAATYLRGVPWVTAPTSLLAMVDASLGGKTGADLPQGKNLVGVFYPPSLALADPAVLATLPQAELRSGLAEVVKHGVIGDPELFELCSQPWQAVLANMDEIVRRAAAVKVRVIRIDPFERGERAALNLGHTLGHALEVTTNYQLRHGEAVSIGMVFAVRLAEKMGLAQAGLAGRLGQVLGGLGLPLEIPSDLDRKRILAALQLDKKRRAGKLRFVLPLRVGEVRWGVEIENLVSTLLLPGQP
ncbi:MAG: 3-dehydroquinate synthase [Anaerolineales bacterium]|nr:3-dehydroquinate synthase [Anaerolineales bacterium]